MQVPSLLILQARSILHRMDAGSAQRSSLQQTLNDSLGSPLDKADPHFNT